MPDDEIKHELAAIRQELEDARVDRTVIKASVKRIDDAMIGDYERPGYLGRIKRLEERQALRDRIGITAITALVGVIVTWLWSVLTGGGQ